jgi:proteic killer suppression protein
MIGTYRDDWLEAFFDEGIGSKKIPSSITKSLAKKLDMVNVACKQLDLISPPSNRFKGLGGHLNGYCSIRVNDKYRLIFKWDDDKGYAADLYLDPHEYKR